MIKFQGLELKFPKGCFMFGTYHIETSRHFAGQNIYECLSIKNQPGENKPLQ